MINTLTEEQASKLKIYRDRYLSLGLATGKCGRPLCEESVRTAYKCAGLEPPAIVMWLDSPLAGAIGSAMLSQVGDQVGDQVWAQVGDQVWAQVRAQVWAQVGAQVGNQVRAQVRAQVGNQVGAQVWAQVGAQVGKCGYGLQDANWVGFYLYFRDVVGIRLDQLEGLEGLLNCGWWWPFKNAVILTERPCSLFRDDNFRLHHESKLAIEYPDGWGVAVWHGTRIPSEWLSEKDPKLCLSWKNAEQRRCLCEMIGWDKIGEMVGAKKIHKDKYGILMELPASPATNEEPARFVEVINPTDQRKFWLPVPREMQRAKQAVAWTYEMDETEYAPLVRT